LFSGFETTAFAFDPKGKVGWLYIFSHSVRKEDKVKSYQRPTRLRWEWLVLYPCTLIIYSPPFYCMLSKNSFTKWQMKNCNEVKTWALAVVYRSLFQ
jgi:hypothetical protein